MSVAVAGEREIQRAVPGSRREACMTSQFKKRRFPGGKCGTRVLIGGWSKANMVNPWAQSLSGTVKLKIRKTAENRKIVRVWYILSGPVGREVDSAMSNADLQHLQILEYHLAAR